MLSEAILAQTDVHLYPLDGAVDDLLCTGFLHCFHCPVDQRDAFLKAIKSSPQFWPHLLSQTRGHCELPFCFSTDAQDLTEAWASLRTDRHHGSAVFGARTAKIAWLRIKWTSATIVARKKDAPALHCNLDDLGLALLRLQLVGGLNLDETRSLLKDSLPNLQHAVQPGRLSAPFTFHFWPGTEYRTSFTTRLDVEAVMGFKETTTLLVGTFENPREVPLWTRWLPCGVLGTAIVSHQRVGDTSPIFLLAMQSPHKPSKEQIDAHLGAYAESQDYKPASFRLAQVGSTEFSGRLFESDGRIRLRLLDNVLGLFIRAELSSSSRASRVEPSVLETPSQDRSFALSDAEDTEPAQLILWARSSHEEAGSKSNPFSRVARQLSSMLLKAKELEAAEGIIFTKVFLLAEHLSSYAHPLSDRKVWSTIRQATSTFLGRTVIATCNLDRVTRRPDDLDVLDSFLVASNSTLYVLQPSGRAESFKEYIPGCTESQDYIERSFGQVKATTFYTASTLTIDRFLIGTSDEQADHCAAIAGFVERFDIKKIFVLARTSHLDSTNSLRRQRMLGIALASLCQMDVRVLELDGVSLAKTALISSLPQDIDYQNSLILASSTDRIVRRQQHVYDIQKFCDAQNCVFACSIWPADQLPTIASKLASAGNEGPVHPSTLTAQFQRFADLGTKTLINPVAMPFIVAAPNQSSEFLKEVTGSSEQFLDGLQQSRFQGFGHIEVPMELLSSAEGHRSYSPQHYEGWKTFGNQTFPDADIALVAFTGQRAFVCSCGSPHDSNCACDCSFCHEQLRLLCPTRQLGAGAQCPIGCPCRCSDHRHDKASRTCPGDGSTPCGEAAPVFSGGNRMCNRCRGRRDRARQKTSASTPRPPCRLEGCEVPAVARSRWCTIEHYVDDCEARFETVQFCPGFDKECPERAALPPGKRSICKDCYRVKARAVKAKKRNAEEMLEE